MHAKDLLSQMIAESLWKSDGKTPTHLTLVRCREIGGEKGFSLAGTVRQIRHADQATDSDAWGGAISFGGKVRTFGLDNFSFHVSYGNALGRYTSFGAFSDGIIDTRGSVRLFDVFAGFAAYQHWWNPTWRSSIAYGYAIADNPSFAPGTLMIGLDAIRSCPLMSICSGVPSCKLPSGSNILYATRKIHNGAKGDLQRFIFSSKFNFWPGTDD